LTEIDALKDDVLSRTTPERFMVPADINNIHWLAALGLNLSRAYIKTPSLEVKRTLLDIIPHVKGAVKFPLTYVPVSKFSPPVSLVPTEEVSAFAVQTGTTAEREYILALLGSPTIEAPPAGEVRMVRCTGNTTLTANEWTSVKITPDIALEAGTYALVGMVPISANAIAARAIITGQVYRPGVPALAGSEADAKVCSRAWFELFGGFLFGTFTHLTIPEIQFLSSAADTSEVVYLYVVKTA
jgi:hypothetical protein